MENREEKEVLAESCLAVQFFRMAVLEALMTALRSNFLDGAVERNNRYMWQISLDVYSTIPTPSRLPIW